MSILRDYPELDANVVHTPQTPIARGLSPMVIFKGSPARDKNKTIFSPKTPEKKTPQITFPNRVRPKLAITTERDESEVLKDIRG